MAGAKSHWLGEAALVRFVKIPAFNLRCIDPRSNMPGNPLLRAQIVHDVPAKRSGGETARFQCNSPGFFIWELPAQEVEPAVNLTFGDLFIRCERSRHQIRNQIRQNQPLIRF